LSANDTNKALGRIKQEIGRLTEEQAKALKDAVYVGMPPEQAKLCDERRRRITKLVQELTAFTTSL
jgi:hypothetical protein